MKQWFKYRKEIDFFSTYVMTIPLLQINVAATGRMKK
jgi:hypothetical protein